MLLNTLYRAAYYSYHDNRPCRSLGKRSDKTNVHLYLYNLESRTCSSVEYVFERVLK